MKKRILCLILCGVLIIGLTGCASKKENVTIVDKEGNTTKLSINDLKSKISNNVINFNDKYLTGEITLTAKVTSISETNEIQSSDGYSCGSFGREYYNKLVEIGLEYDWISLVVVKGIDEIDLENLSVGDIVTIKSNIAYAESDTEPTLWIHSDDGEHCEFGKNPTIVTKQE